MAVVVWVYSGGGEAEVRGFFPFLDKTFPGCKFERKTPVSQNLALNLIKQVVREEQVKA